MRVAVYYHNQDVRVEERPIPQIGPGELLVRVARSGICGSDVMEWYRRPRAPVVLGHEIAGHVAVAGKQVKGYKEGDRVTAAHHVPCNACHYCLAGHHTLCDTLHRTDFDPGGFAEYIRLIPIHVDRGVFHLPPDVSDEDAVFVEPLACVLRAQRRAGLRRAQSVLVVGSGIAGLLHVKLARASGAGLILAADINEFRLQTARRFGADAALPAEGDLSALVRQANDGELADLVIVCTSAGSAIVKALAAVRPGGTLLFFAPATPELMLPVRFNDVFWRTDLTLTTSYGASPADYAAALALLHHRRVQVQDMVTHRLGLSQVGLGFQVVAEAKESIKVVLDHDR